MSSNLYHTPPVRGLTSRLYETEHDLQQTQDLLMAARSRTDDWRFWHVGEWMWGFLVVACHLNPQEQIRLWHDDGGQLAGYAVLGEDPSFECQVVPGHECSGIDAEAMQWGARGMDRKCVSTGVSNTPARRLYESAGFVIVNQTLDYVKPEQRRQATAGAALARAPRTAGGLTH